MRPALMAATIRPPAPARPSRLRDSQQPRPSLDLTPRPQCVFEHPAPPGGRQKGIYIYLRKQRLPPLRVLKDLIKSLILIIFVMPEKVPMSYCPAQKYKRKICPCIDPQYSFLMPTVPRVALPFTIGMDGVIPEEGSRRHIQAHRPSWSIWPYTGGQWPLGHPWIVTHS